MDDQGLLFMVRLCQDCTSSVERINPSIIKLYWKLIGYLSPVTDRVGDILLFSDEESDNKRYRRAADATGRHVAIFFK